MELQQQGDSFSIWTPVQVIEKAGTDGATVDYKNMRLKGIASTEDEDLDSEVLKGNFDLTYLMNRGFINWHHQSRTMPAAIIGEPEAAKITNKGLYVEARLYDQPIARQAFDLARMLERDSKRRRLGWSIEGKVLERNGSLIKKAAITGIALTYAPKNARTFAVIAKAFHDANVAEQIWPSQTETTTLPEDRDYDVALQTRKGTYLIKGNAVRFVEKALNMGAPSGEPGAGKELARESLEGGLKLKRQPDVLKRILNKYPNITFEKAIQVYDRVLSKHSQ